MPEISVVMPVYNGEEFVGAAIESVLNQTFSDFEFIIINDGSTDGTMEVVSSYAKKDARIRIINNVSNIRLIKTLNIGLAAATGKYIVRMDADDICLPNRLHVQKEYMDANPSVGISGTYIEMFGGQNKVLKLPVDARDVAARLLFKPCLIHPSVIIRRELLTDNALCYNEQYLHAEDYGLWVEALPVTDITNIPAVTLKYRVSETSISSIALKNKVINDEVHKKIYRVVLDQFGMRYSDADLSIHRWIGSNADLLENSGQVAGCLKWLKKIKRHNNDCLKYNKQALNYSLCLSFLSVLKRTPSLSLWKKGLYILKGLMNFGVNAFVKILVEKS